MDMDDADFSMDDIIQDVTDETIKFFAKEAIDNNSTFKPYVEQILESLANTQVGRKKEK